MTCQSKTCSVHSFAALHVGEQIAASCGSSRFGVVRFEISSRRTTDHKHRYIASRCSTYGSVNVVCRSISHSTTLDILDASIGNSSSYSLKHGNNRSFGLRRGVIAKLIVRIVGIRTYNGNALDVFAQREKTIVL